MTSPDAPPQRPADSAPDAEVEAPGVPLLHPREGLPAVVTTAAGVAEVAERLAAGHGPLAVDTERASAYRYTARAYLIQLRRAGAGTALIDPIPVAEDLAPLAEAINPLEWVLHAADQDLFSLAELGLHPETLFDTELAGRLAGFERVSLAAMTERTLGFHLAKGHGAADWSSRPLPEEWLNYAALDVELLVELRDILAEELATQGKTEWARQEFEHERTAPAPVTDPERWRRTSNIHSLTSRRELAAVRELWISRDDLAQRRDIAPGRVLPDRAIVNAATADPRTTEQLRALPVFGGPRQRRQSARWLAALEKARALPANQLPTTSPRTDAPPPANRWARKDPVAAERLQRARAALSDVAEEQRLPVENVLTPSIVRRLVWTWKPQPDPSAQIDAFLADAGARPWQRSLAVAPLAAALAAGD